MDASRLAPVALGAAVGAGLRWAALEAAGGGGADVALLVVNVAGSLVLGAVLATPPGTVAGSERGRDLLGAGLCGALTSWSALALQLAVDTRAGRWDTAAAWLAAHLVLGIGAVALSFSVVRRRTVA